MTDWILKEIGETQRLIAPLEQDPLVSTRWNDKCVDLPMILIGLKALTNKWVFTSFVADFLGRQVFYSDELEQERDRFLRKLRGCIQDKNWKRMGRHLRWDKYPIGIQHPYHRYNDKAPLEPEDYNMQLMFYHAYLLLRGQAARDASYSESERNTSDFERCIRITGCLSSNGIFTENWEWIKSYVWPGWRARLWTWSQSCQVAWDLLRDDSEHTSEATTLQILRGKDIATWHKIPFEMGIELSKDLEQARRAIRMIQK